MDVEALIERYEAVSEEDEAALVRRLAESGWEAGCWLRPPPEQIMLATQHEVGEFLERLGGRKRFDREPVDELFANGLPQTPIEGEEPCYIVLAQRCDLVNLLKAEPFVELAPAAICRDRQRIANAWRNSPREFPIEPHADESFIVDLRYRFFVAKLDLVEYEPKQALPEDEKVRQGFVLRTGQRYTRAAVPDNLVEMVVRPLADLVLGDAEANRLFTEWALYYGGRPEEKPGVQAVYQVSIDTTDDDEYARLEQELQQQAEDKFQAIIDALPVEAKEKLDLDEPRTQVIAETDLTVARWRLSWKLEWDSETLGGDVDAATPAR
jgi:hypothetical protein